MKSTWNDLDYTRWQHMSQPSLDTSDNVEASEGRASSCLPSSDFSRSFLRMSCSAVFCRGDDVVKCL
jgi:hypothetical protein